MEFRCERVCLLYLCLDFLLGLLYYGHCITLGWVAMMAIRSVAAGACCSVASKTVWDTFRQEHEQAKRDFALSRCTNKGRSKWSTVISPPYLLVNLADTNNFYQ